MEGPNIASDVAVCQECSILCNKIEKKFRLFPVLWSYVKKGVPQISNGMTMFSTKKHLESLVLGLAAVEFSRQHNQNIVSNMTIKLRKCVFFKSNLCRVDESVRMPVKGLNSRISAYS